MKGKSLSILLIFSLALNLAVLGTFIFFKLNKPDFYRASFDRVSPNDININDTQREKMIDSFRELHKMTIERRKQIKKVHF